MTIRKGFTLLEVLVAFALLSILLVVIIQSQSEAIYFLDKTGKLSLVQNEVMNGLSVVERNFPTGTSFSEEGVFPHDHPLAGDRWQKTMQIKDFLMGMIKIRKYTYRVIWDSGTNGAEQSFESSIFGELR